MTKNHLIRKLCKIEGKKVQVSVGNMREIISALEQMIAQNLYRMGVDKARAHAGEKVLNALIPGINRKIKKLERSR